jgi:hypothetical protein
MAQSTLPVIAHPLFPQVYPSLFTSEVRRVERILGSCCHDRCQAQAEVSDLNTGIGLCFAHFRVSGRG